MSGSYLSILLELILSLTCLLFSIRLFKEQHKLISISYIFIAFTTFLGALHYAGVEESIKYHVFFGKMCLILASPAIGYGIFLAFKNPISEQKKITLTLYTLGFMFASSLVFSFSEDISKSIGLVLNLIFSIALIKLLLFYFKKSNKNLILALLTMLIFIYIGFLANFINVKPFESGDIVHIASIFGYSFIFLLVIDLKKYKI
ncbi:MAG: hypothetical protein ACEQSF_06115 [Solirubrobacteraceae bacterium]